MGKGYRMDELGGGFGTILYLGFIVLLVIGQWKVNEKGGVPGWWAIIPILNVYGLLKIVNRPVWWLILFLIPLVGFIVWILVMQDVAKAFGRSSLFGIGLAFLSGIFLAIIGFGEDRYQGAPNS